MSENRKQAAISSVCTSKPLPPKNHSRPSQGVQMAVFNNNWKWDRNVIKVHFMQKSKHCGQGYILKCASEWSKSCRIKFEECPERSESDIRIDFENTGNWSFVGVSACHPDLIEKATMNLGIACSENIPPSEDELRGTILHEFGHVLGFLHEHQSPRADLKWNREKVIKYYGRAPNNWSMDEIESNILTKLDDHRQHLNCTAWDPKSIMHYGFASEFLLDRDGRGIAECYELSAVDIEKVAEVYSVPQLQQQDPSPMLSDQSGSGKPPAPTKTDASITSIETFMEHFKEDFQNSEDVDTMAIVEYLELDKVMPVGKCSQVKAEFDPYNKRKTIYCHMRDQGTYSTLLGLCKAMKAVTAYARMYVLGDRMQKVLEQNRYNFPEKEQA